jgi:cell division protein FtsB
MISRKRQKRKSLKTSSFYQGLIFFFSSIGSIVSLILYLWIFKEIDESILLVEIQSATARSLKNDLDELKNEIENLSRSDIITARATNELNMTIAIPETLVIAMKKNEDSNL